MKTHPTLVLALSLLSLGPFLVPPPAAAQDTSFGEVIDVEVVNVDVYVTDKKGRAVTGLDRGDFVLRADGEPVEITNFYAVENGRRLAGDVPEVVGATATRTLAGRTQAALVYELADNPLGVGLEIGQALPMDDGLHLVPIRLHIPLANVSLVPGDREHVGHLTLYLAGRDRGGRLAPVRSVEVPIRIPAAEVDTARRQLFNYEIKMLMRPGEHAVAVGIHDDYAAVGSFMTENVQVAEN